MQGGEKRVTTENSTADFSCGRKRAPESLILERQPDKLQNTLINSDGLQFWHHISLHSELAHLCNWCSRVDVLHVARKRNASRTHSRFPDFMSMRVHEPRSQMAMRRVISNLRGSEGGVADV